MCCRSRESANDPKYEKNDGRSGRSGQDIPITCPISDPYDPAATCPTEGRERIHPYGDEGIEASCFAACSCWSRFMMMLKSIFH